MRLNGVPVNYVMEELNVRNHTPLKVWMNWYREEQPHRLEQTVGKQYTYGKGPKYHTEVEQLMVENRFLKQP